MLLVSVASNTFTNSATFSVPDSTSLLDSGAANSYLTTTFAGTQLFAPGVITISGFCLKVCIRATVPVGIITARLFNSTGSTVVAGSTVSINISDLAANATNTGGYWVYFKFASPITLAAATNYQIQALTSVSGTQISLFRDATATNWSRMLLTTTTQSPAALDDTVIVGAIESPQNATYTFTNTAATANAGDTYTNNGATFTITNSIVSGTTLVTTGTGLPTTSGTLTRVTGSGSATIAFSANVASVVTTKTSIDVTVDTTNATTYGNIYLCGLGTLKYRTTSLTNSHLKLQGNIYYRGGSFSMGSIATPIPASSTANLEFVSSSPSQYGIIGNLPTAGVGQIGSFTMAGAPKDRTSVLTADASLGATSISVAANIGWVSGDSLAIAPTTRTYTQFESKVIGSPSGLTVPIAALTYSHSGTSPTQAEVGNLTSNVKIFGQSSTNSTFIRIQGNVPFIADNVEFYNFGSSTGNLKGIECQSINTQYITSCAFHDCPVGSIGVNANASSDNVKFNNNIYYGSGQPFGQASTTGLNLEYLGNVCIGYTAAIAMSSSRANLGGNVFAGASSVPITLTDDNLVPFGAWSNNTTHSNNSYGANLGIIQNRPSSLFYGWKSYRNGSYGIFSGVLVDSSLDSWNIFGNSNVGFIFNGRALNSTLNNFTVVSEAAFTQPSGISCTNGQIDTVFLDNSTIGNATVTHSQGDITASAPAPMTLICRNTSLLSPTKISAVGQGALSASSSIRQQRINGTAGNHSITCKFGIITPDYSILRSGSLSTASTRLTPNNTTNKLNLLDRVVAIPTGNTATIGVWVRKSNTSAGDAATYNGNQIQLIIKANPAAGITTDTVLATSTNAANGAWQFIYGVTPTLTDNSGVHCYVNCDGNAGFINIVDWSLS